MDDLTPLDARDSLLIDHRPDVKDQRELGKFNYPSPYEPYRDQPLARAGHNPTGSTDRLVDTYYAEPKLDRSLSRDSQRTGRSGSPENYKPVNNPHYGLAIWARRRVKLLASDYVLFISFLFCLKCSLGVVGPLRIWIFTPSLLDFPSKTFCSVSSSLTHYLLVFPLRCFPYSPFLFGEMHTSFGVYFEGEPHRGLQST